MSARQWLGAAALVCGFVFAAAALEAWEPVNGLTYLTFNRPIALPGVTLGAGTYAFEVVNPTTGADVVMVRDRARTRVYFHAITNNIDRSVETGRDGAVLFGETRADRPTPIIAWLPPNSARGHEFIYHP